jgi:hypothetical protein
MVASPRGIEPVRGLSKPVNELRAGAILQGDFLQVSHPGPPETPRGEDMTRRDGSGVSVSSAGPEHTV